MPRERAARRTKKRQWEVRTAVAMPRAPLDELEIRTSDGAVLRAVVLEPPPAVPLRATAILAHAMFARRSSFGRPDRPGLAQRLTERGLRTVAFDFRGHGESTSPSSAWGYDDLVRHDLPAVVECARARAEGGPLIVVGHSLGGHVALAAQGTSRIDTDGVVAIATNVWLRACEPSTLRWTAKQAIARSLLAVSAKVGSLPARRLRFGSDDAPDSYVRDLFRGVTGDAWQSRDGREDYLAALPSVTVPVAAVVGDRDRVMCHPTAGEAFARRCSGEVAFFHAPVGHMELATSPHGWPAVVDAVEWTLRRHSA
jgi:predicted alpha/beta hydrolase